MKLYVLIAVVGVHLCSNLFAGSLETSLSEIAKNFRCTKDDFTALYVLIGGVITSREVAAKPSVDAILAEKRKARDVLKTDKDFDRRTRGSYYLMQLEVDEIEAPFFKRILQIYNMARQLKFGSPEMFNAISDLNRAMASHCEGEKPSPLIREIHGFAYHRIVTGPIIRFGIEAEYLSGRSGDEPSLSDVEKYETRIDYVMFRNEIESELVKPPKK